MTTTTAELRHGANVLRALARNLQALTEPDGLTPPLDHPSARDALTLLAWHGESTCVRVVDRLEQAGLVARSRPDGDRRIRISLTPAGERAAGAMTRRSGDGVERLLREALSGEDLTGFVRALDRVAVSMFGDARDTARFCRSCDVQACLAGGAGCPSDAACRANLAEPAAGAD
jgi:hypothetical protein